MVNVAPRAGGTQYLLIGHMVGLVLLGFSLMQSWMVLHTYRKDPWQLKVLVYVLAVGDIIQSVCGCQCVNAWLVTYYAQPQYLDVMLPGLLGAIQAGAIIAYICQMFFAWRVHRLRKQWWLTALIVFFGTAGVLCATGTIIGCAIVNTFSGLGKLQPIILTWSACVVVCDIFTTASLVYALRQSITGFHDTDSRVGKIKNLILQTFVLTMAIDLLHLIIVAIKVCSSRYLQSTILSFIFLFCSFHIGLHGEDRVRTDKFYTVCFFFHHKPNDLLHLCFNAFVAKLYTNSLFSTLNTRDPSTQLLGQGTPPQVSASPTWDQDTKGSNQTMNHAIPMPSLPRTPSQTGRNRSFHRFHKSPPPGNVHITTVQEQFSGLEPEATKPRPSGAIESAGASDTFDDRKKSTEMISSELERVELATPSSLNAAQELMHQDPPYGP